MTDIISGIGIDIEEISRFSQKPFFENQEFYKKIFTEDEISFCLSKSNPYPHFAVRFCAKEATIKSLNTEKIMFNEIEVVIKNKTPYLILPNGKTIMLSMSHSKKHAIAFVINF